MKSDPPRRGSRNRLVFVLRIAVVALVVMMSSWLTLEPRYYYVSSDRRFVDLEAPSKGRDVSAVRRNFERYVQAHGDRSVRLYRVTPWRWYVPHLWISYCINDRWSVPCHPELMQVVEERQDRYMGDELPRP